jgi:hypothetical protein
MSGDYTRFSFDPRNRYSGVLMQQGRVQLDSDWNEEVDILRRRIRTTTLDILGPVGVPYVVSPNAFKIGFIPGSPADLSIGLGRLYVDGVQIEIFAEEAATYRTQPFFPKPLDPALDLPNTGNAVVYLDVWDREVTYIEDPELIDPALGGPDTTTRRQTVWQVRVATMDNAACGVPVGDLPSAGRLTSRAIAPPAPDDPCILPPASGYRGLENRLYRVEIHNGGALGTARFKWSRDNGSIVSAVRAIAVSGTQTTLTVHRIGRDQFLRLRVGDWVTVTDNHREWMGETGEMALIVDIDETNRQIVLDRALPTGTNRPFGANADELAARHTRIQRWDQTGATNTVDGDGLILTGGGPIPIEDGIEIQFSTDPAGGSVRVGDYWVFWARTATATIEELTDAPPRGIVHHYVQLAAINGLGGADPLVTDCRPPPPQPSAGECCCTIIVKPGENIQAGINALPPQGGCVCLKTGLHVIREPLRIARGSIVLKAESPGTVVRSQGSGPVLTIGNPAGARIEGIDILGIDFVSANSDVAELIVVTGAARVRISHCGLSASQRGTYVGIHAELTDWLRVTCCRFSAITYGVLVLQRCQGFEADENIIELSGFSEQDNTFGFFGIAYANSAFPCRVTRNAISGALFGISINDQSEGDPTSLAELSIVTDNIVICPEFRGGTLENRPVAIDVAANSCTIRDNRVRYSSLIFIGIRVTGSLCETSGNVLLSTMREANVLGPVAIQIGAVLRAGSPLVIGGIVANNSIVGPQTGIVCIEAPDLVVDQNIIETSVSGDGFAIVGAAVRASRFSGNHVRGVPFGIMLSDGGQNEIAANYCRDGSTGIALLRETAPRIFGNRLDRLSFTGLLAMQISGRLDVIENRLSQCAINATNSPTVYAAGIFAVDGEVYIAGNEILDTGSDGGPQATTKADYGIVGSLIRETRITGNLITYTNAFARDPLREDRALLIQGLLETTVLVGGSEITTGFPAQVEGNKFVGTGRGALVELLETRIDDRNFQRFERVSFDQNYCMHVTAPEPQNRERDATVRLTGRRMIVMGNHIKATTPRWPSVNFDRKQGPFIGNVTSGGTINHPDFPVTEANFNQIG